LILVANLTFDIDNLWASGGLIYDVFIIVSVNAGFVPILAYLNIFVLLRKRRRNKIIEGV
jgi:hypothetical protein